MAAAPAIRAGGGVLWRESNGRTEVALVHRPRYDDWSLPKGKCKTGEQILVTALREVQEETGHRPELGPFLGQYSYQMTSGGRVATKKVRYWAMQAVGGAFELNDEVDELRWLPVAEAGQAVSFAIDRLVLQAFSRLPGLSSVLLVVRGGSTGGNRRTTAGLNKRGKQQAAALTPLLAGLGVSRLASAAAPSCRQMLRGYAAAAGIAVDPEAALDTVGGIAGLADRLLAEASGGARIAVCGQGPMVNRLLTELAHRGDATPGPHTGLKKGGFYLMHIWSGRVVSLEGQEVAA